MLSHFRCFFYFIIKQVSTFGFQVSLRSPITFGGMKMLPIAGDFLSCYTKAEADCKP